MRIGLLLLGCTGFTAASSACGDGGAPAVEMPVWSRELPPAGVAFGPRRGLTPARGIIHLHSPYSHDACDGKPRDEQSNAPDEKCLADLRAALCDTRMDFAAMTDHDDSMADEDFDTLYNQRGTDTFVDDASGTHIASRMDCPNGHSVLITVGGENEIMPIMVNRHPEGTVPEVHDVYNAYDAATMQQFRDLGGLSWLAHSERHDLAKIRELAPDGIEIYQLHANLDPDIRKERLGLSASGAIRAVAEFADTNEGGPEPDLALMAFLEPNQNSLDKWDTLLGEGMRLSGSGGTDAHQNALPIMLSDGERGDSYRRMLRWFSNVVLVDDAADPAAIQDALGSGRFFVAFELFGTPTGFDFVGADPGTGGAALEMGAEVSAGAGATVSMTLPEVYKMDASLPAPEIRGRILRVDSSGVTEVAEGAGPILTAPLDRAGAYRAEVMITPLHYAGYLRRYGTAPAEREHVWIYTNPIYVTP